MPIRIAAWNVGHQTDPLPISEDLVPAILELEPQIVVLTEFVPAEVAKSGRSRKPFFEALERAGMRWLLPAYGSEISRDGKRNHTLIASNLKMELGDLKADKTDMPGPTNFLHVRFPKDQFELIGLRVPAYKSAEKTKRYWRWLTDSLSQEASRPLVVIGDMNLDPANPKPEWKREYTDQIRSEYQIADPGPSDAGSCVSKTGKWSRIDHAFVSKEIRVESATYIARKGRHVYAGGKGQLSDHSVLILDIAP